MSKETSTKEMKDVSKLQEEKAKPQQVKKDTQDKIETSKEKKIKNKRKEEPQLPVSESPRSITYHSSGGSFSSSEAPPVGATAVKMALDEPDKVEEGIVDGGRNSGYLMSKKEAKLSMVLLGLRIATFVFCLVSFSVLATDTNKGPFSYSFYTYKELNCCLAANVIGCAYTLVQICELVKYLITKKHTGNTKLIRSITFAIDQVLTYLLLAAATSAAGVISAINTSRELQYLFSVVIPSEFVDMATASVVLSFLAFKSFAMATLLSGYILCKFNY
ncbi:CASP-like protein N24 [Arachis stenosperma]|uniref:CASP-like protein N24 n=1 Tax=Arachis stenosperma TaxID=217475 RepID=UPI0025AB5DEE|nr:CASP-like protein N24 [Arachis stenosperma]